MLVLFQPEGTDSNEMGATEVNSYIQQEAASAARQPSGNEMASQQPFSVTAALLG
jgi:hypothetical protein